MKSILITGGTGSFGKAFLSRLLMEEQNIKRIVVYSRDELKQFEMANDLDAKDKDKVRFFLGDVRDKDRLKRALEGVDEVIHAAALKQVPAAEYNPFEFIKTNVLGAQNLIECSLDQGVRNIVALSTDKAAGPINLYGATKLCSDKLFVAANTIKGNRSFKSSVVRYGNVMGSRGSVIPYFQKLKAINAKEVPITDKRMTRFNISLDEGVDMVRYALSNHIGGEIFVPKIPSYNILDLKNAILPETPEKYIGIRPGEKLHEEMITESDSPNTFDLGKYYAIVPAETKTYAHYINLKDVSKVELGFKYNSATNEKFLSTEELKELIE
tara:strand:- start:25953 stop:26930 length:978 start_codon:yes stop_codon:yes gene_type:complete